MKDSADLMALDAKINAILPPRYQSCYDDVKPESMGSAGLKFGPDGKVAWDEIWTSFCDLALAGGPPHRGQLLEPVPAEEVFAEPESYQSVVEEIGRGIWMVTGLPVLPRIAPGWVGVRCRTETMAAWLVRAIVVENVSARHEQDFLYLPAGPRFRLDKEIKNVVTVLAKTCHHWSDHMTASQQSAAASLAGKSSATVLLEPATPSEALATADEYQAVLADIVLGIRQATGLPAAPSRHLGWINVPCADEEMAVWLMRAVIVENVMVRREGNVLHLPANSNFAVHGLSQRVVATLTQACRLWEIHIALKRQLPQ